MSHSEQASGGSWRDTVPEGCAAVVLVLLFLIVAGVGAVALIVGVEVLAGWMVSLIEPLIGPPVFALIGAASIIFAGWAGFRLATGHAPPGTSRRDMSVAVVVVIGLAVFGVVAVIAGFAPQTPDSPGF